MMMDKEIILSVQFGAKVSENEATFISVRILYTLIIAKVLLMFLN